MRATMSKAQMETADPREFIRLLMENERRIYAYIRTMLGNSSDADDVLQETSIILWDKFSEFDPDCGKDQSDDQTGDSNDGSFIAWSFKVAYFTAQNFRRKKGRSKLVFSDSLFEKIADKTAAMTPKLDQRHELLEGCMSKLSKPDQTLLKTRYELGATIETTAQQSGRSVQAVYKALQRIRAALFQCIKNGMAGDGETFSFERQS